MDGKYSIVLFLKNCLLATYKKTKYFLFLQQIVEKMFSVLIATIVGTPRGCLALLQSKESNCLDTSHHLLKLNAKMCGADKYCSSIGIAC